MNALSHIGHAAQLLREVDSERAARWMLYTYRKQLKIKPADHADALDQTLLILTRLEIRKGLTPARWSLLEDKIRIAQAKGVLI